LPRVPDTFCRSGRNHSTGRVVGEIGLRIFLKVRYDDANDRYNEPGL
jgi:hypothetical protein